MIELSEERAGKILICAVRCALGEIEGELSSAVIAEIKRLIEELDYDTLKQISDDIGVLVDELMQSTRYVSRFGEPNFMQWVDLRIAIGMELLWRGKNE